MRQWLRWCLVSLGLIPKTPERQNPFWFVNESRATTMVAQWQRMLDQPDNPDETDTEGRPLRRGHAYRFEAPDRTVSYIPKYVRLFSSRKKEQAS